LYLIVIVHRTIHPLLFVIHHHHPFGYGNGRRGQSWRCPRADPYSFPMAVILVLLLVLMKLISSALAFIQPRPRSTSSCSFTSSPSLAMMSLRPVDTAHPYHPPTWTDGRLNNVPRHRLHLANLPTPIHRIGQPRKLGDESGSVGGTNLSRLQELNITLYIKRDDATGGVELGGNKVRKLEFLLADALAKGCDSVVTIGGEQSNHCRATAAARSVVSLVLDK
jgi:hypothetical protein